MVRAVLQVNQCGLNTVILRQDMALRPLVLFSPSSSLSHTCALSKTNSFVPED